MSTTFGGNGAVDFSGQSCGPIPATMVYKSKCCELCGRNFTTLVMAPMRDCADCTAREAARLAELARPLPPDETYIGRPRIRTSWKRGKLKPLEGERLERYREYQKTYRAAKRAAQANQASA